MTGNLLGIHAGVWVGDWADDSARYAIESSAQAGYDLIEIPAVDPRTTDLALTVRLLEQTGLDAVVSLALDASTDINTEDAEVSAHGERLLSRTVDFARDIGARYIGGVTYSAMVKYTHPATEASRQNSLAVLRRIADKARASGITIGVEYVNRYESNLLNTAAQTVRFIEDLDAENVLLHLDTFHANSEELSLAQAVRDAGALLGYIHASESHRGHLGTGILDFPGLFRQLALSGYTGPITFESFSSAIHPRDTADTIGIWRDPWTDPALAARNAYAFLRAQLDAAALAHAA
ncbi:sugar phosphate isomerase/epimerase family protein [Cryobacterium arcticum]|uniref:Epimerase n=1 Tax=Cryobacterium arcticum TaxID=670052 RepID=A0A1B1BNY1_9MICO|nr:sugar phosphate isomerase/epimerase [Cryobacterium arcticum]ANP74360.1 Epimerase [Cryobacterium arcticum]